jgi:hypothetical protein
MYAQTSQNLLEPPADRRITTTSRAVLRTRPLVQRALIRSWEYIQPVRVTVLVIRQLVVLWLLFLGAMLVWAGYAWGWALPPTAIAMFALSLWVFSTAGKGWPVEQA